MNIISVVIISSVGLLSAAAPDPSSMDVGDAVGDNVGNVVGDNVVDGMGNGVGGGPVLLPT